MLRCRTVFACVGLLTFAAACTRTVPDTRDADVKAVKAAEADMVDAVAAKDLDRILSYDADDASILMPNTPIIRGKANMRAVWKPLLADPNFKLTFQSTRAEASKSGDLAYTIGIYSMTASNPKSKTPTTDRGKYLTVFKKQADGSWKIEADMVNSDLPVRSERTEPRSHRAARTHRRRRSR